MVIEGSHVRTGQVVAVLENREYEAARESARARLSGKEAELRRVVNGARLQERRAALAEVREAEAVLENARAEHMRRQGLYEKGAISREEADRAEKAWRVAKARCDAAIERHRLADDPPREEDCSRAEAEVALARSDLEQSEALLAKTFIKSPINGVVLRKYHNTGENVATGLGSPIVAIGDVSRLRVRADVDENDVAAVRIGQRAYITASAYGSKRFYGRVTRLGEALGRKNVHTDEPTEHIDTKILETLIELDLGQHLPPNLRVDVFIEAGDSHAAH
jgi:ABC exporter DevB family membrane fusion protein